MQEFVKTADCRIQKISDFLSVENGEAFVQVVSQHFVSPNSDVESFLRNKSIQATKLSTASSYLVYSKKSFPIIDIAGYFTLATKMLNLNRAVMSKSTEKIISRFGYYDEISDLYHIPAILLAQFGRNFNENCISISGKDLMSLALNQIKYILSLSSGKTVFLECEKKQKLIDFYKAHGFLILDNEVLSKDKRKMVQLYRLL